MDRGGYSAIWSSSHAGENLGSAGLSAKPVATTPRAQDALDRLTTVFRGRAGRTLTLVDAAELAGLDEEVCHKFLQALCDAGFLEPCTDGEFKEAPRPHA